ncbi:uncharacterized protein C11orf98-like [Clavelina lepadiformis]|uniref:uncharacterized protein C11orf98-like n=1 Tax=Clavelina lepadiformis TaxID=159417 RepID=UPI0040427E4F
MVSTTINRPKKALYKNLNKLRRVKKQRKKKNKAPRQSEIPDPEIIPAGVLKKRMTSARANITLSGKKKRKILKQIRRTQTENAKMDVAVTSSQGRPKVKNSTRKNTKLSLTDEDVEMEEM